MTQTYTVVVGEVGNEVGHVVSTTTSLHGARVIAGRELKAYGGDGWAVIRGDCGYEERRGRLTL